jgi:hypothetical protein
MDKDEFGHGDLIDRLGRLGRQPVPQHIARRHMATIQGVLPARPWRRPALAMAAALTVAVGGGAVWAAAGSRSGDGGSVALEQPPGVPPLADDGSGPQDPPADTPATPLDRSPDDPCTGAPPWAGTGSSGTAAERAAWRLARAVAGCPIDAGAGTTGAPAEQPEMPTSGNPGVGNPGLGNDNGLGNAGTVPPGNPDPGAPPATPDDDGAPTDPGDGTPTDPGDGTPATPPAEGNPGLGNDNGLGNAGTVPPGNPDPGTPPATPNGSGTPAGGRADG